MKYDELNPEQQNSFNKAEEVAKAKFRELIDSPVGMSPTEMGTAIALMATYYINGYSTAYGKKAAEKYIDVLAKTLGEVISDKPDRPSLMEVLEKIQTLAKEKGIDVGKFMDDKAGEVISTLLGNKPMFVSPDNGKEH